MKLKIITSEEGISLEENNLQLVEAETLHGHLGILPKHLALICSLTDNSYLSYQLKDQTLKNKLQIQSGFLEVGRDQEGLTEITVLASQLLS